MTEILPGDLAGTRLFLLSHVDPLMAIEVADQAARDPERAGAINTVIFGAHVAPVLQPLFRQLLSGALDEGFTNDLFDVIEHARLPLSLAGLRTLRGLSSTLTIAEPTPPHDQLGTGAMTAPDAVCDLMMQPLMAFSNLVVALSEEWVKLAAEPDLVDKIFYRSNQASHFDARLENRLRRALGFTNGLSEGMILNIP